MKLFLKIIPLCFLSLSLNAEVFSGFFENDVVNGEDKHYTNGAAFSYLSNKDTNDLDKYNNSFFNLVSKIPTFNDNTKYQTLGMTLSHFTFTPDDSEKEREIIMSSSHANKFKPAIRAYAESVSDNYKGKPLKEIFSDPDKMREMVTGTPERFRFFPNAENNIEDFR